MLRTPPKTPPDPLPPEPAALRTAGAYLTDGRRLFWVVTPLRWSDPPDLAQLEDCASLEVRAFSTRELRAMRLTAVW